MRFLISGALGTLILSHGTSPKASRANTSRHARELQQEQSQCDARALDAPATHCAAVLSRHNAKIAAQSKLVGPWTMISAHGWEPSKATCQQKAHAFKGRGRLWRSRQHDPTERMSACMAKTRRSSHKHHAGTAQICSPRAPSISNT